MKTYIKPELQVINVSSASMICGSSETLGVSNNDYNGAVYSPSQTMGFDDDDN